MELSDIDLNLLVLFQQLMVERRVSKAADNLGLTQSAVSNALAKMRRIFDDELFLRTSGGMVPTPFAEQLAEPVGYALGMIYSGLNQRTQFTPATLKRTITMGMTDIGEIVFLPTLLERLSREAPGVTLNTVRNNATNLREDMEAGKVDLAIGLLPQLKAGFFQRRLFRQRYVCLFRKGHTLDRPKLLITDYKAAEHLVIVSAGTGHGIVDELIRKSGIDRIVRLSVPHFVSVGHILQGTELVATVPERLAQKLVEPFGLVSRTHPVKLPEAPISMFWHAKVHREPVNQWLRGMIFELFGGSSTGDIGSP
ncbi:LysR family transcriptional regulator (plasmid) [Acidovorax sp. DW039]|uniref:LysR family transcriptional regulator n=1 Tax=Acidovorax sp. DW039 TaxID=3095606 RepID=UPI003089FC7F|nr:LysR family transcriptional regulator [Acidovorax sp. DW039]